MSDFKTYKDLDIYKLGLQLFLEVHGATLKLPKYELYELGSQLRRSADSVVSNIVEGYGRKRYKADFIKFLTYSWTSSLETVFYIEKISKPYPEIIVNQEEFINKYNELNAKIYNFIKYVEDNWKK